MEKFLVWQEISYQTLDLSLGVPLPKPEDFTHIVILGGPMNVYEEGRYPFLRNEDLFIKEAIQRGRSLLGICLGAQLIAKALGAKVFKAPVREIGWYDVSLTKVGFQDPLFSNLPKRFPVFQWHEDTFEIPIVGQLIATSDSVFHQAFRYGENAYGLQFHLEVTEEMIREWLESYEEEVDKNKILAQTGREIESYKKRGMNFFARFFERHRAIEESKQMMREE
jgi:GMP synthase-like glutamine amidotransferase